MIKNGLKSLSSGKLSTEETLNYLRMTDGWVSILRTGCPRVYKDSPFTSSLYKFTQVEFESVLGLFTTFLKQFMNKGFYNLSTSNDDNILRGMISVNTFLDLLLVSKSLDGKLDFSTESVFKST